jgi:hypothetical protein
LYLSGAEAARVAPYFDGSFVDAIPLNAEAGAASALKMAYAAWTKGSDALLINAFALASKHQLSEALLHEWSLSQPQLTQRLDTATRSTAPKAWRFSGEMEQIAKTLEDADLPGGAYHAAAEVYQRIASFKNAPPQDINRDAVIDQLINSDNNK